MTPLYLGICDFLHDSKLGRKPPQCPGLKEITQGSPASWERFHQTILMLGTLFVNKPLIHFKVLDFPTKKTSAFFSM